MKYILPILLFVIYGMLTSPTPELKLPALFLLIIFFTIVESLVKRESSK